jgi:hypothetical protein
VIGYWGQTLSLPVPVCRESFCVTLVPEGLLYAIPVPKLTSGLTLSPQKTPFQPDIQVQPEEVHVPVLQNTPVPQRG